MVMGKNANIQSLHLDMINSVAHGLNCISPLTGSFFINIGLLQCISDQAVYLHHFLNVICNFLYGVFLQFSTLFHTISTGAFKRM